MVSEVLPGSSEEYCETGATDAGLMARALPLPRPRGARLAGVLRSALGAGPGGAISGCASAGPEAMPLAIVEDLFEMSDGVVEIRLWWESRCITTSDADTVGLLEGENRGK